ncbi:hypothetical protein F5148DRAFT_1147463 [Russula earlei]|uniref:Uncharacterized protein n=1 Tax=Russula earlei TaxID=71964 RepID=A0ACC0UHN6_9AGAM|nr:hypothetical protein F5148DRAFT_1147463 [Russula earlei]
MSLFRTKEHAQRKYIDLIKEATSKWPNWNPTREIQVGDFGKVNIKTGDFIVEGNIYTDVNIAKIASQYPPVQVPEVDYYQIPSYEARALDVKANGDGADKGILFKTQWQFNNKRGALFFMYRPRSTRVPKEFFNPSLLPILRGKFVVYQVWRSPGFYMYLSNRSSEKVTVGLRTNATAPGGANASPSVTVNWFSEGTAGVAQHAYRPDAEIRTPLLRRDESSMGIEGWHEADVPWDDLDEEGVTEPETIYDNGSVSSDDDD